jgi:hypothetical protein
VEDILYVFDPAQDWDALLSELAAFEDACRLRDATLEDVFLQLTGRGLLE